MHDEPRWSTWVLVKTLVLALACLAAVAWIATDEVVDPGTSCESLISSVSDMSSDFSFRADTCDRTMTGRFVAVVALIALPGIYAASRHRDRAHPGSVAASVVALALAGTIALAWEPRGPTICSSDAASWRWWEGGGCQELTSAPWLACAALIALAVIGLFPLLVTRTSHTTSP